MNERVLIYRLGSLGDTVSALPCFHKIAEAFPKAERIALTNFPVTRKEAPLETVLGGSGLIHLTIEYPIGIRSPTELWALSRRLQALHADTLIYLMANRGQWGWQRDALFFRLSGVREIVGLPSTKDLQNHRVGEDGSLERECERLVRCIAPLGPIDLNEKRYWDLLLTKAEKAKGHQVLEAFAGRAYIAINMGGKAAQKDWGNQNWRCLLEILGKELVEYGLLIVGAADDFKRANAAAQFWPGGAINTCGQLSPRESGSVMARSCLFVGHDSGPLHLAAAMGVTCVGLFGAYNKPRMWHPYGPQHEVIHDMRGISFISVREVVDAVMRKLV